MASQTDSSCAILIPVHFPAGLDEGVIRQTLEDTLRGQDGYCPAARTLLVVDQGAPAERILENAGKGSPLVGLPLCRLPRNRGKTEAVRVGLQRLLETTDAALFITRDCDGDHAVDDLPRLLRMAAAASTESRPLSVFGARSCWEKPMGWLRQEWERLTNRVLIDLTEYLVARQGDVLDRRFWNGLELDLQSGYRLYDRQAARIAVDSLSGLPDNPEVYTMACEMLPFVELSLKRGRAAQIQTLTRLGQPFSSYAGIDWPRYYGSLLAFAARRYGAEPEILLRIFDNHLVESPLHWSSRREDALRCRNVAIPGAPPLEFPPVR